MKTDQVRKQIDDALEELGEQLEQGASEQLLAYLSAMARFTRYSWGNILLISLQRPDASRVAGYQAWRKLGRQVKKGEKGIAIMAPIVRRGKKEEDEKKDRVFAFKTAHVFDVDQTEGKPLVEPSRVQGDPGEWAARLNAFVAGQGIQIVHLASLSPVEGASLGGTIAVRRGLSVAEEFSVLVHEVAHELMHREDRETENSKTIRETEAEAVAFVVCQAVGLDTGTASSDYLSLYQGDQETLTSSLGRIQRIAARIIDGVMAEKKPAATMAGEVAVLAVREAA